MMIPEDFFRLLVAAAIQEVLNELAADHYDALTQEPPLSARAGQQLEDIYVSGLPYDLKIITLDIPDRGGGALEKPTGTDLYVGVEVTIDGVRSTKGFLVQAKWDHDRTGPENQRLRDQCKRMLDLSDESYVWSYGEDGISVESVQEVLRGDDFAGTLADLFDDVLECSRGDRAIGLPDEPRPRIGIGEMLKKLNARRGLGIFVSDEFEPPDHWRVEE